MRIIIHTMSQWFEEAAVTAMSVRWVVSRPCHHAHHGQWEYHFMKWCMPWVRKYNNPSFISDKLLFFYNAILFINTKSSIYIGFWHEQSRPDRDQYVDLYLSSVKPESRHNFATCGTACGTQNLPYDYMSVMHYSCRAFSVNGDVTLVRKGCGYNITCECQLGQRNGLSSLDLQGLNILYGCSDSETFQRKLIIFMQKLIIIL